MWRKQRLNLPSRFSRRPFAWAIFKRGMFHEANSSFSWILGSNTIVIRETLDARYPPTPPGWAYSRSLVLTRVWTEGGLRMRRICPALPLWLWREQGFACQDSSRTCSEELVGTPGQIGGYRRGEWKHGKAMKFLLPLCGSEFIVAAFIPNTF